MRGCVSEKLFNRYVEGKLDSKSLKGLEEHVGHCEACRKELEGWRALKESLDRASHIAVPESLKTKVMERTAREKIKPAVAGGPVRRNLALAFVSLILLYYVTKPILGSLVDQWLMDAFKALSVNLYAFLDMIGIDPSVPIKFFGSFMANAKDFIPIFVTSAFLMVIGFFIVILKGKTAHSRA